MSGKPQLRITLPWSEAIAEWAAAMEAEHLAPSTVQRRVKYLRTVAATLGAGDPFQVTAAELAAWFRAQSWAGTTASGYRTAVRAFYRWATSAGRVRVNPAEYLERVSAAREGPRVGRSGPLPSEVPAGWHATIALFVREQRALGRTEQTIVLRRAHLAALARDLDPLGPWEVTFYDLVDWMAGHRWARETRRSHRSTVRAFYSWAAARGLVESDPAAALPKTGSTQPHPRPASEGTVRAAVLSAVDRDTRLMVRLAAELGMRRAEVAAVHSRDVIESSGGRWALVVHGKGQRERVLPLPSALAVELRARDEGYLFPGKFGGHITPANVGRRVSQLLPDGTGMHALRHRFASRAYALEHDLFAVQSLLGHASPETTRRYVAVPEDRMRRTVELLAESA